MSHNHAVDKRGAVRCKTGKKIYTRRIDAERASLRRGQRPYRCNFCQRWHLTTKARKL